MSTSGNTYDTSVSEISYSCDAEYRAVFRRVFGMTHFPVKDAGIDAVTADENDYDATAAATVCDYLFAQTQSNALFGILYQHAAATMLSLDHSIGLAVLLSYDYFASFHHCLCVWLREPHAWTDAHPAYIRMLKKIK
jgi:hypothetical protein